MLCDGKVCGECCVIGGMWREYCVMVGVYRECCVIGGMW